MHDFCYIVVQTINPLHPVLLISFQFNPKSFHAVPQSDSRFSNLHQRHQSPPRSTILFSTSTKITPTPRAQTKSHLDASPPPPQLPPPSLLPEKSFVIKKQPAPAHFSYVRAKVYTYKTKSRIAAKIMHKEQSVQTHSPKKDNIFIESSQTPHHNPIS